MPSHTNLSSSCPAQNGPVAFWFINDMPEPAITHPQLKAMAEQGFTGVVIHPRDGMQTPYLSETWFNLVEELTAKANELGMDVWFYDENPFPSGTAGGLLLDEQPELGAQVLDYVIETAQPTQGRIRHTFGSIRRLVGIYAQSCDDTQAGESDWINVTSHAGLVAHGWMVRGPQTEPYGPDYDHALCDRHWRANIHQESWTLDWRPPHEGAWRLLAVWRSYARDERHGQFVDQLHPATAQAFIRLTHQQSLDKLGQATFDRFRCAFIDEPRLCHAYPWTHDLPQVYQQRHGRCLKQDLPAILLGDGDHARAARLRYRSLLADLWIERFWQPLKAWCVKHDLPLTGHLSPEEDPVQQHITTPGWTRITGMMDWPGCDQITSLMGVDDQAYRSLGPKLTSSLAQQQDKSRVMVETLGVSGEGITLARMRRMIDWLAICGCNTFVIHGQYMSLAGHRKREAPPSIFVQQPYWPFVHQLSEHMQQWTDWQLETKPHRPIAVLYPSTAFYALGQHERPLARQCAKHLGEVVASLMRQGLDFDLVADADLRDATLDSPDQITVGQAQYDTLILPDIPWTNAQTLAKIQAIASQRPHAIQSLLTRPMQALDTGEAWEPARANTPPQTIATMTHHLIQHHRSWHTLANPEQAVYVHSRWRSQTLERTLWNPADQPVELTIHHAGENHTFTLPGWAMARLALPEHQPMTWDIAPPLQADESDDTLDALPSTPWTMQAESPNTLRLGQWSMQIGSANALSICDLPLPTETWRNLCQASQPVRFETAFTLPDAPMPITLVFDREAFASHAEVTLNSQGVDLTRATPSPRFADAMQLTISSLLRPGDNRLMVTFPHATPAECPLRDPLYLAGDFLVQSSPTSEAPPILSRTPAAWMVDGDQSPDWACQGYPHYSGVMRYTRSIHLPEEADRLVVEIPASQQDPLEVSIDGQVVGSAYCFPACLTWNQPIRAGGHTLTCRVANTRINYTEGVIQPSGLLGTPTVKVAIRSAQTALD